MKTSDGPVGVAAALSLNIAAARAEATVLGNLNTGGLLTVHSAANADAISRADAKEFSDETVGVGAAGRRQSRQCNQQGLHRQRKHGSCPRGYPYRGYDGKGRRSHERERSHGGGPGAIRGRRHQGGGGRVVRAEYPRYYNRGPYPDGGHGSGPRYPCGRRQCRGRCLPYR